MTTAKAMAIKTTTVFGSRRSVIGWGRTTGWPVADHPVVAGGGTADAAVPDQSGRGAGKGRVLSGPKASLILITPRFPAYSLARSL
ncbi:MAG TPA: hypothetical protein VGO19_02925 [Actinomycetes bacterium]